VTGRGSAVGVSQVIPDLDGMIVSTGEFDRAHWTGRSNVWTCGSYDFTTNRRTEQMVNNDALVRQLYEGFNRRDIPAVLTLLAENVDWANGMDGGHVHGRDAVRAYWTKQWAAIAPQVDPCTSPSGTTERPR
jgi:SnoaL-like domain